MAALLWPESRNSSQRLMHVVENFPFTLPSAQTARLQLYGVVEGASSAPTPPLLPFLPSSLFTFDFP